MERFENMQTVLPGHVQMYLRQLAIVHYGSLHLLYDDMVKKFINVGPWAAKPPLPWREAPMRNGPGCTVSNVTLSSDIAMMVDQILEDINNVEYPGYKRYGITRKTFLYTAVMWWVTYIYPRT
ncbi:hypothetical protein ACVBEF_04665 [Glaciimonas sp. GG7]